MTALPHLLLDLFEALAELEALCASLAAQRVVMADLPALEDAVQRMAEADLAAYPPMNFDFHDRVCRLARNGELARVADGLRRQLAPLRRVQLGRLDRQQRSVGEHRALVAALYERDGPLAGSIMRAHLRIAMREVLFTDPQPASSATS